MTASPAAYIHRLLLLLVIGLAAEKGRCSLPPLTWVKDPMWADRKPVFSPNKTVTANDAPSCAMYCSNMDSCSAFFFNPKTLVCDLHKTVLLKTKAKRTVDAPGFVYYRIKSGKYVTGTIPSVSIKIPITLKGTLIVQELCESRGDRPGLSVLTSLLASVNVKIY